MRSILATLAFILLLSLTRMAVGRATTQPADDRACIAAMREVHQKFTGKPGTLAHFGDSITVSLAYWAPLHWDHKNMDAATEKAYAAVEGYMVKDCWDKWRGPAYGNDGGQTSVWADQNVGAWLKKLNPEVAVIMFGTNDLNQIKADEYAKHIRSVVRQCLDNGTVVILSTIPPRSGKLELCKAFAAEVRTIGRDLKVPVIDYLEECLKRRPDDWDGASPKFKEAPGDSYQVPTLISKDGVHPSAPKQWNGDYSDEALNHSGFGLRTYLTLIAYNGVIETVLKQ